MRIRVINTFLLLITVIGALLAYRAGREYGEVRAEHTRLEAKVGRLPIRDRSKIHVMALETEGDLFFTWRLYLPANCNSYYQDSLGAQGGMGRGNTPHEQIWRLRLRESDDGTVTLFEDCGVATFACDVGDQKLADVIRGRWNEFHVEQLGADGIAVVESDEVATLIRIALSDDLKKEIRQELGESYMKRYENALYQIQIGSDKAFQEAGLDGLWNEKW